MSEIVYHSCDFCGNPTRNERPAGDELLCQSCRHDQAKRLYRPAALEAALKCASEHLPATLNGRLLKAYDLCASDHVARNGRGWMVKSQVTERVYQVNEVGCNCEDAYSEAPEIEGRPACKHQLAVWLEIKAEGLMARRDTRDIVVKSRTIRNGTQTADVIEGRFDRQGDAEQFADELARDVGEEWPASLQRMCGHYRLFRGDSQIFVWVEAV